MSVFHFVVLSLAKPIDIFIRLEGTVLCLNRSHYTDSDTLVRPINRDQKKTSCRQGVNQYSPEKWLNVIRD